ncbi:hypothetical protein AAVH_36240, partial [Aphelenchoides avenae]
MNPVLLYESFSFCSRDDLERLQPLSQSLLDMIVAGSNALPLRPIDHVVTECCAAHNKIEIFVEENEDAEESDPEYEASIHDGDFAEIFRRLQYTCTKELRVGVRDAPFLRYWKSQEAAAFVTDVVLIWDYGFPPPSFILEEPGFASYELWCFDSNVADGIDVFIESFVRDGCANQKLKSVYIKWDDGDGQQSPVGGMAEWSKAPFMRLPP